MPGMQCKVDLPANSPATGDRSQRSEAPSHRMGASSGALDTRLKGPLAEENRSSDRFFGPDPTAWY